MAHPKDAPPTIDMTCQICKTISTILIARSTPARCSRCGRVIERRVAPAIVTDAPAPVLDVEHVVKHRH